MRSVIDGIVSAHEKTKLAHAGEGIEVGPLRPKALVQREQSTGEWAAGGNRY